MAGISEMSDEMRKYLAGYDNLQRFVSYYYQIDLTRKLNVKQVLEIGIGNKTVSDYLRKLGLRVTTLDLSSCLHPDVVGDASRIPFKNESFDAVLCFQVLEHLPWGLFPRAISEISRVTREYAILSLPHSSYSMEIIFRGTPINKLLKRSIIHIRISLPRKGKRSEEHYWEIGLRQFPPKKIRHEICKHFHIERELRPPLNPYHHFFLLRKRGKRGA